MEVKKCPYCAEDILIDAIKCKHCGEFLNEEMNSKRDKELLSYEKKETENTNHNKRLFKIVLLVLFIFFILKMAYNSSGDSSRGEQKCPPIGTVKTGYYGHCPENFQKLLLLKQGMKDPNSFEVVSTEQLEGGKLKVKYRATNGFGAIVTETKTLY